MIKILVSTLISLGTSYAFAQTQSGLKTINYENETSGKSAEKPALTPEQMTKVNQDIEAYKKKKAESDKILEELDQDE